MIPFGYHSILSHSQPQMYIGGNAFNSFVTYLPVIVYRQEVGI